MHLLVFLLPSLPRVPNENENLAAAFSDLHRSTTYKTARPPTYVVMY